MVHSRACDGPYGENGFAALKNSGFRNDILVTDGGRIYLRHKAFNADLSDADKAEPHVIASGGFTDSAPQHRTYWTVSPGFLGRDGHPPGIFKSDLGVSWGDILVTNGKHFFEVRGFPVKRHSYFDPRLKGYQLYAGSVSTKKKEGFKGKLWDTRIPFNGEAMAMAGDVIFVAGRPLSFAPDHPVEKFQKSHAGELGGVMQAISATDGRKLAEYKLDAPPAWDGMAVADGRVYLSTENGGVICYESE